MTILFRSKFVEQSLNALSRVASKLATKDLCLLCPLQTQLFLGDKDVGLVFQGVAALHTG
jgi:hypothetical protein